MGSPQWTTNHTNQSVNDTIDYLNEQKIPIKIVRIETIWFLSQI